MLTWLTIANKWKLEWPQNAESDFCTVLQMLQFWWNGILFTPTWAPKWVSVDCSLLRELAIRFCQRGSIFCLCLLVWKNWHIKMLLGIVFSSFVFISFAFEGLESNYLWWIWEGARNHRICIKIFCGLRESRPRRTFPAPGSTEKPTLCQIWF